MNDRNKTVSSRWFIAGRFLSIEDASGHTIVPTADQIFSVAVELKTIKGFPPIAQDRVTQGLTFSRMPLALAIVISRSLSETPTSLCVRVRLEGRSVTTDLDDLPEDMPDHVLISDTWYPIAQGQLNEVRALLEQASVSRLGKITIRQYLGLRKIVGSKLNLRDESLGAANAIALSETEGVCPPDSFVGALFPYQRDGLNWLSLLASEGIGGVLADEMGLGKTVQIVALLLGEKNAGRTPSLVVAPSTLLENWRRELAKFAPSLTTRIHRGPERTGFPSELQRWDVVLTSFDTLVRDLPLLRQIAWNVVILDEAQAIKNPETQRAQSVKHLPRRVGIAVTGTPVENRLRDLWSLVDFSVPDLLGDQTEFDSRFEDDLASAEILEPLVSPILLRRQVSDVAQDLPDRIEIPQALEMSPMEALGYEQLRQQTIEEYGAAANLVSLQRLRMYCTHASLTGSCGYDPAWQSTKYLRLTEILEEIFGAREKAILFTSYNAMSDLIRHDLTSRFAVPVMQIDGRTPIDSRQQMIDVFGDRTGGALLVLNPRAAGTGLNITAANHVIHYNLEWNPAIEDQATARAHRRGQELPVTVHRLFYVDTVEEVIAQRMLRKRALASAVVVGTDGKEVDVEDILDALKRSPIRRVDNA